jgi:hypothetical protein
LCATCEEDAPSIHDKEHTFIKIRYPIQSLLNRPLLPKFKSLKEQNYTKSQNNASTAKEMESTGLANASYEIISKPEEIIISRSNSSMSAKSSPTNPVSSTHSALAPLPATSLSVVKPEFEHKISAAFVSDLNIPDGTVIVPKKTFIKVKSI